MPMEGYEQGGQGTQEAADRQIPDLAGRQAISVDTYSLEAALEGRGQSESKRSRKTRKEERHRTKGWGRREG